MIEVEKIESHYWECYSLQCPDISNNIKAVTLAAILFRPDPG